MPKKSTPRYVIFKLKKTKTMGKSWKKSEGKNILRIEEHRWELHVNSRQKPCKQEKSRVKYLKCWGKKNPTKHKPRIWYPANLSFTSEGQIKTFSDDQKKKKKSERIHFLQTCSTRNVKRNSSREEENVIDYKSGYVKKGWAQKRNK